MYVIFKDKIQCRIPGGLFWCQNHCDVINDLMNQIKRTITYPDFILIGPKKNHIDPYQASVPQVADFLEFLCTLNNFTDQNYCRLSVCYRCCSSWLGWCRCWSDKEFTETVRADFIARPLKRRLVPKWYIGFVLQALYKHPFEP